MSIETPAARRAQRIAKLYRDDRQARAAAPDETVLDAVRTPGIGVAQIVASVLTGYAERPALGQRAFEIVRDPATGRGERRWLNHFDTLTYADVAARVEALAAAWADAGVGPGTMIGLLGVTGVDLTIADLACVRLGAVVVPLQAGAASAALVQIATETEPRILVATPELLDRAVDCALACPATRRLVVIDHVPELDAHRAALGAARERLAGAPIAVDTVAEVIEAGRDMPRAALYFADPGDDPLAMLIYTSGSTGTPKGAMYTDRLAAGIWVQGLARKPGSNPPAISVNYMPLSHLAGRLALAGVLVRGGIAYFTAAADMSTLFDDIALVRPTEMVFVPRVSDMIYQRYQSELAGGRSEEQVRAQLRGEVLGGRLISASTGSAPLAPELKAFMESLLEIELHDAYGSTEAGGGLVVDNRVRRPVVIDYKLVDVPELGYLTRDRPHPRGELLLKTATMIPGYYRRPDITAQVFDADGFYRTGDIVAEIGPDRLRYLDRRNNVLKLSQGEFVAVAQLEAVYAASPLIRQIFVYGSSVRPYLLAVVVPTEAAMAAAADADALAGSIAASVRAIAADAGLEPYEIPREFIVEPEPFTIDNGLLSGIGKLLRPALERRYGPRLEQLYRERADGRSAELRAVHAGAGEVSVVETVLRAARALLDCTAEQSIPQAHFADLGGDSLSALSLATVLTEIFGVDVPVSVVTGPATTLGDLAEYIGAAQESGTGTVSFAGVHGAGAEQVVAADVALEKFIDAQTLRAAPGLPVAATTETVLLTGANGYLGRWLCLLWLQRMRDVGGRVLCVVRAKDVETARDRLAAAFDSGDADLLRRYRELADDHLEVIVGDISASRLGLDEQTWQELARRVDRIVHCAALVNHVLPYEQLFGPNVVGTAELIRLAITHRLKPFTYLSTVAVAADVDRSVFTEGGDIRAGSPVRSNGAGYATGYGNSKWAGEVLLRSVHELCGLPVAVFRSDMVLAHPRYAGQLNVPDMFTRLLIGLVCTGLAPASFYRRGADGGRARAHYDGLPADFTAEAITVLGAAIDTGHHSFHVVNPHDDGISLDVIVDWLIEAGIAIERVDDYAEWLARFEAALRALPEPQRGASVLPLLHAFARPAPATAGSALPATEFRAAVRAAELGPDADIPHLTADLVAKYVGDLRLRGLIP